MAMASVAAAAAAAAAGNAVEIVYASQGGTAVELAADVQRGLRALGAAADSTISSFRTFWEARLRDLLRAGTGPGAAGASSLEVVFVISTTGQGDFTSDVSSFWDELLTYTAPAAANLKFTVFGLGDSRYPQFNVAARKLRLMLLHLGAVEFYRYALGDATHAQGVEAEFDIWQEGLYRHFLSPEPLPPHWLQIVENYRTPDVYSIGFAKDYAANSDVDQTPWTPCVVNSTTRLTTADREQVQKIQLTLPSSAFWPGDCLSVMPQVPRDKAEHFVRSILRKEPKDAILFSSGPRGHPELPLNQPISLMELFSVWFDICAIPSRYFFRVLATAASHDELKAKKCAELGGFRPEDRELYLEYCQRERRSYADVLWDFSDCVPPLSTLLSCIPRIQPRLYSIASHSLWYDDGWRFLLSEEYSFISRASQFAACPRLFESPIFAKICKMAKTSALQRTHATHFGKSRGDNNRMPPCRVDLCVARITHKTKHQRVVPGLCSSYLCDLQVGDRPRCRIVPGNTLGSRWSLPFERPLLAIATGTGIAPIRAVLQGRAIESAIRRGLAIEPRTPGRTVLLQGCRHPEKDFLFSADWKLLAALLSEENRHFEVMPAFSRLRDDQCDYVQNVIDRNAGDIARLLFAGAGVLICGKSTPMPHQVKEALRDALCAHARDARRATAAAAEEFLESRARRKLLLYDTWG